MNDIPGTNPVTPPVVRPAAAHSNWRTALADLIGARIGLIQMELRQAAESRARRGVFLGVGAGLLLFAWGVILAGAIGAISDKVGYPWYWVALIAGGIHLLVAAIFINVAKKPGTASFEITRAEFKKDREWLENFQAPKKSND